MGLPNNKPPGKGTTLRIYLLRAHVPAELGAPQHSRNISKCLGVGMTVLAVDDNDDVWKMAIRRLEKMGYRVHEACDGPDALTLLPQLPTVDLANEARTRWPKLKVLFTSGFPALMLSDSPFGPNDILLSKPYRQQELSDRIGEAMKS